MRTDKAVAGLCVAHMHTNAAYLPNRCQFRHIAGQTSQPNLSISGRATFAVTRESLLHGFSTFPSIEKQNCEAMESAASSVWLAIRMEIRELLRVLTHDTRGFVCGGDYMVCRGMHGRRISTEAIAVEPSDYLKSKSY